jgi:hypothetical protein
MAAIVPFVASIIKGIADIAPVVKGAAAAATVASGVKSLVSSPGGGQAPAQPLAPAPATPLSAPAPTQITPSARTGNNRSLAALAPGLALAGTGGNFASATGRSPGKTLLGS